ncbi:hypothetical protein [uncultured Jannaschia sp.]|uniref:hypothetical protein n=1 Tax=uncultured Jannaschia sp. TaxID=293347 RepID=UPI0026321A2D|nr:hypothetical protein [uncultured Jannaschia sp.]
MPLYQFTNADTNEKTRRIVFQGEDVRTFLPAGTYAICRIEETFSPPATVEIPSIEAEPPAEDVAEPFDPPEVLDPPEAPTAPEPTEPSQPTDPVEPPATPDPVVEPETPTQELLAPEILLPEDGTIEIRAHDGVVTLTITKSGNYDGEYEVDTTELATKDAINLKPAIISGEATMGSTLTATPGLWVYDGVNPAPTITAEWRKDNAPIAGATGPTYVLANDYGASITYGETTGNAYQSSNAIETEPMPVAAPAPAAEGFAAIPKGVIVFDLRTKNHLYADRVGGTKVSDNDQDIEQFEDLSGNGNHYARVPGYGCPITKEGRVRWSDSDRIQPVGSLIGLEDGMELFVRLRTSDPLWTTLHVSGSAAWGIVGTSDKLSPNMDQAAGQNITFEADGSAVASNQLALSAAWTNTTGYVTIHMRGLDLSKIANVADTLSILSEKFVGNIQGIALTRALTASERAETYAILAGD